jgi:hypothetical protein
MIVKRPRNSARPYCICLIVAVISAVAVLQSPSARGAEPTSGWRIQQFSEPTVLIPGSSARFSESASSSNPDINFNVINMSGETTTEPITLVDTLPSGVSPAAARPGEVNRSPETDAGGSSAACTSAGQIVTCIVTKPVAPGTMLQAYIPVDVSPNALPEVENQISVAGGGQGGASSTAQFPVSKELPDFGFLSGDRGLFGTTSTESGSASTQAGSHPSALDLGAAFPDVEYNAAPVPGEKIEPVQTLKDLQFSLPQGYVVDPLAVPVLCTEAEMISANNSEGCPPQSQIGEIYAKIAQYYGAVWLAEPLYDMEPPPEMPAEFAFQVFGTIIHVAGGVGGTFNLTAKSNDILGKVPVVGIRADLWGDPSDPRHDAQREGYGCPQLAGCSVPQTPVPLLTAPGACETSTLGASAASWEEPNREILAEEVPFTASDGTPLAITGCDKLSFSPSIKVAAESQAADSPTGLSINLEVPQTEGRSGLATANLKKVVVHLPEGMAVNPPAANGLGACSEAEIGIGDNSPSGCPASSRIGTAKITTPLLPNALEGSVYLAEQKNNPFGTLLALYLVVEGEGVVIKIPGRVDADSRTGQLIATFDDNPQLPFNKLQVQFNGGSRGALVTPSTCGSYTIATELTSWASPTPVVLNSPMIVNEGCGKGSFNPGFEAGTTNPVAGAYSPFTLRVTRQDGEQNLARISATLPMGLLARLNGVALCPDAQAATGDCPDASRVGSTTTGIGAGTQPLYIPQPGKSPTAVYLAGSYKGAPYSLVVKVPAQAGPFDLGTIAVRVALSVDPYTAQVTASSDPLPQILEGIPIVYRDVRVNIDRESFTVNPTSCEPMLLSSTITSINGLSANPSSRFQVAGCEHLAFKPSLKISLKGGTKRTGHPALKAVVTYPKKGAYADIARAQVSLPHSEFLDQSNIGKTCTKPLLAAHACPAKSIYGKAKAWTPLLEKPLSGNVYLVGGYGYKLPALVAELNGQIRVLLVGKVDSDKQQGIRNTFEAVPDAPVDKFVLEMKGGKKYGLLINSEDICKKKQVAGAAFRAQNGKVLNQSVEITNSCKGQKKGKH